MSVYCVALIDIRDRERYGQYEAGFVEIFSRYQGEVLAVDEQVDAVEGEWPWTRTVVLRFPDRAALDAWYLSEDYQALMQHRVAASSAALGVLKGLS